MKLFDENGSFIGEFIEASESAICHSKDVVIDAFDVSIILGILGFIFAPWWTLFAIIVIFIFKLLIKTIKLILNTAWWIFRLPFSLIFKQRVPEF